MENAEAAGRMPTYTKKWPNIDPTKSEGHTALTVIRQSDLRRRPKGQSMLSMYLGTTVMTRADAYRYQHKTI